MATIENFATVTYTSGDAVMSRTSNVAEIELNSSLNFTKTSLGDTYAPNEPLTYILSVTNSSDTTISNIVISDDLGATELGTIEITPLTYTGPALLLINGQDSTSLLTVDTTIEGSVLFTLPTLAPGATANIVYKATPNSTAPLMPFLDMATMANRPTNMVTTVRTIVA